MGSSCCKGDPNAQVGELQRKPQTNKKANSNKEFSDLENDFLDQFPEMKERVKQILEELPHNWIINHELTTYVDGQGYFLGKKNTKVRSGYGIMLYDSGFYYVGCWQDNSRYGMGIMVDKYGNYYKGEWVYDEASGYGEYYDSKQSQWYYKGKWKNGKKEGVGEQNYPDGVKFVGQYKDDLKNGAGKFFFDEQNDCYFEGQLKNDKVEGQGIQKTLDYIYEGPWKRCEMQGAGTVQYFDERGRPTDRYVGEFEKSIKHGYGQYRWADGTTYKGEWKAGQLANRGVLLQKT